ncbi:putative TPR-like repeat [Lyophyllum shimeji]|uniref:Signal recognition particle subunit SRP72 n=1 Tax=Lyophyllum shimeji TaxID=47721 RepID=A0A9P3PMB0_LYOSH|nr:putative TPR-like repeat [Lyophyllum shimeji]
MATKAAATSSASDSRHKGKENSRKSVPKQPLSVPERLKRLFTSLCAQIDGGHFNNAIKTCDKILRLEPNDIDANQTKLFLLLQAEQYDAALSFIENSDQHAFEKAYSLYRLQQEDEARQVLQEIKQQEGEEDRGVLHLEAQLSYRDGSYEEAVDLYNVLLETVDPQSDEHSDILINLQAAQQHLDFIKSGFLHALDSLPTSLTATMESNPPPVPTSSLVAATVASAAAASASVAALAPTEKKVRKSRVPPGVIPGVTPPPDPERWLKKSERSTFGQGKRRKGPGGGGATQGSAAVDTTPPTSTAIHAKPSGTKGKKKK